MAICNDLWAAGIKAEYGYKPNPKMGDQLNYALEEGIPFMVLFGEEELAAGNVKIKDMEAKSEDVVTLAELVPALLSRLAGKQQSSAGM
ncbi:histidyl-tRNA synthetase [Haematococcus lacustris]|uniref:Histidyl-tRNA synthetase n=1 Tax=Haematococcus lacustris TaxID=44745 RepID=A0A6A0AD84_HAELA|nr:histidyl-tRNA synthetase [Haematococcus lacustris]